MIHLLREGKGEIVNEGEAPIPLESSHSTFKKGIRHECSLNWCYTLLHMSIYNHYYYCAACFIASLQFSTLV